MKLSYLSYFFTYETHIPDGIGFALFGPWHLLCFRLFLPYASDMYGFIKNGMKEKNAGWMV